MSQDIQKDAAVQLPGHVCEHIDTWLQKFPKDQPQSATIAALEAAQEHFGWLSQPVVTAVADYLKIPVIQVYEVATFYDMFFTEPKGKHIISFCTGVACMLRGVDDVVDHAKKRLGIGLNETTPDGKITLQEVQCMAACDKAPMCQINQRHYHNNLNIQQVDQLLESLQENKEPVPLGENN